MALQCFQTGATALAEKATGRIVYLLHPFGEASRNNVVFPNRWPKPLHGPDVMEVAEVVSENYQTAELHSTVLTHSIARAPGLPAGIQDGDQFFLYPPEEIPGRDAMPTRRFSVKGLNVRSGSIDLIPVKYLLLNPQTKASIDFEYLGSSGLTSVNKADDTFTLCGAIRHMTWDPSSSSGPVTDDPIVFGINHRTKSSGYLRLHWLSRLTPSDKNTWREQNMPVHHFAPPATGGTELSMSNLAMTGPLLPPPAVDHDFNLESCASRNCKDHDWEIQCDGAYPLMEERRLAAQASNAWSGSNVGDQAEMLEAFADTIGWD